MSLKIKNLNQKGVAHLLLLVAVLGLIAFIAIANTSSFKNGIFGSLFPKQFSFAATDNSVEVEAGTITSPATVLSDSNASGGQYVQFGGAGGPTPPPTPPSQTSTPNPTATPGTGASVTVAAAGDIACGTGSGGAACQQMATSNLLMSMNPDGILLLGDNQYENGGLSDYNSYYAPSWGRAPLLAKTYPSIGNHEYLTGGASGYFDYFERAFGTGNTGKKPGARGQGYYSFDIGTWHLIAVNSNCGSAGGCGPGSAQYNFVQADLAAHRNLCTLAFWHHEKWGYDTSGGAPGNAPDDLVQLLYDNNAELILVGHSHTYQRLVPMNPNHTRGAALGIQDNVRGIRQIIVGTGGRNFTPFGSGSYPGMDRTPSGALAMTNTAFGVLKLTLSPSSYSWQYVPIAGQSFSDTGTTQCH